jgi:hypothetical protein
MHPRTTVQGVEGSGRVAAQRGCWVTPWQAGGFPRLCGSRLRLGDGGAGSSALFNAKLLPPHSRFNQTLITKWICRTVLPASARSCTRDEADRRTAPGSAAAGCRSVRIGKQRERLRIDGEARPRAVFGVIQTLWAVLYPARAWTCSVHVSRGHWQTHRCQQPAARCSRLQQLSTRASRLLLARYGLPTALEVSPHKLSRRYVIPKPLSSRYF